MVINVAETSTINVIVNVVDMGFGKKRLSIQGSIRATLLAPVL